MLWEAYFPIFWATTPDPFLKDPDWRPPSYPQQMISSPPLQKNSGYQAGISSKFLHSPLFLCQLRLISLSTWPRHFPLLSQEEVSYLPFRAPLPPVLSNPTITLHPHLLLSPSPLPRPPDSSFTSFTLLFIRAKFLQTFTLAAPTLRTCVHFKYLLHNSCHTVALALLLQRSFKPNRQIQRALCMAYLMHPTSLLLTPQLLELLSSMW